MIWLALAVGLLTGIMLGWYLRGLCHPTDPQAAALRRALQDARWYD